MAKRAFFTAACILALAVVAAAPARAGSTLNASWIVTYYADPNGTLTDSQCINFSTTQRKDGAVTGTWSSPTLAGWSGGWVQKGEHFTWYGSYPANGQTIATFDAGDFVNGTIAAESSAGAFSPGGAAVFTGTATLMQVKSCASSPVRPANARFR